MSTPFRLSGGLIAVTGSLGGPMGGFKLTWAIDFLHNEIDLSPGPSASATP